MVAKVEWHPGELVPRFGFIVTNLSRPAERVVAFYNQRGKAEQYIKASRLAYPVNAHDRYMQGAATLPSKARHRLEQRCRPRCRAMSGRR